MQLITVRFNTEPYKITVNHAYTLTMASKNEDIETFYNVLEDALDQVHKKDIIIITSD